MVVQGRLWRVSNPALKETERQDLVIALMNARRAVKQAKGDPSTTKVARRSVDAAKVALGERWPVWWEDGAPDYNRKLAKTTPYRDWFERLARFP